MIHSDDIKILRANARFITAAMRAPLLEHSEEISLATRWRERGDQAALHALVTPHARLVFAAARRFRRYGLPMGDLIQEGNLGLMLAAARFEPMRAVRFATYAEWWVRARLQDFVLRNWSIVRAGTTRAQKALFFNFRRLRARLEASGLASSPDAQRRIAKLLNVSIADLVRMKARLGLPDQSLNDPIYEGSREQIQDVLADEAPNPEDIARARHDSRVAATWLSAAMAELSPRERMVIRKHRLAAVSLGQIGTELGISKERVRQIEERALAKLRESLMRRSCDARDLLPC